MSEPKRYEPDHEGLMYQTHKGNYVLMQDYARLEAQIKRLTDIGDSLIDQLAQDEGYNVDSFKPVREWWAFKKNLK
jgi:hypothetical protein